MPSRVRVAAVIGGRVYFGRHIISTLGHVEDSAGIILPKVRKGLTWKIVLETWQNLIKYLPDCKLYIIRERRGLKASRSLFNHKLLWYRRKKKKMQFQPVTVAQQAAWNVNRNLPNQIMGIPDRRQPAEEAPLEQVVYENIDGN